MRHLCLLLIILGVFSFSLLSLAMAESMFSQSNLTILTQGERYIGYKLHQTFRFPWQDETTYSTIKLPETGKGVTILFGKYRIFNTILAPTNNFTALAGGEEK